MGDASLSGQDRGNDKLPYHILVDSTVANVLSMSHKYWDARVEREIGGYQNPPLPLFTENAHWFNARNRKAPP